MPASTRRTRKSTATTPAVTTTPDEITGPVSDPAPAVTPDETTTTTATDPAPDATGPVDGESIIPTGSDTPADAPMSDAPVSDAPVSGAPVGSSDHLKIVMVAGVLGDHPDGVSAA